MKTGASFIKVDNSTIGANSNDELVSLSGSRLLPTPKVIVKNGGFSNIHAFTPPSSVLANDPTLSNQPLNLHLYYEGNDNVQAWMSLPELKYELLRAKATNKRDNLAPQKNNSGYNWMHPAHNNGINRIASNYSGGEQKDYNNNTLLPRETEWDVITTSNKGTSAVVGNNPFTPISIDPKLWFYNNVANMGSNILPIRVIDYVDAAYKVSGQGRNSIGGGIASFIFCFRMSAADPTTWNPAKNRYDKRIFSNYSEPFKLRPHAGNFIDGSFPNQSEKILYAWRITPA